MHSGIHVEFRHSSIHVEWYRYEMAHCLYTVKVKRLHQTTLSKRYKLYKLQIYQFKNYLSKHQ